MFNYIVIILELWEVKNEYIFLAFITIKHLTLSLLAMRQKPFVILVFSVVYYQL